MPDSTKQKVRRYCSGCYVPTCDFRGPCRFPHGCCYSILGLFSAVGGLLMNLYVLGSCFFQRIQLINHVTGDPIPGSERGYGFLSRETDYGLQPDYKECTWYPKAEYDAIFDGWMHTGRIFAFISAILASVCFSVMFLTCCMAFSSSMFERWLFWMYIVAAITIALSFFIFGSEHCKENDCKVADGSGWAISAFMFHLVAANTVKSFATPTAAPSRRDGNMEDDDIDEELDDLYYDNEEEKYPPPRPEGLRGVTIKKNGEREFDNGEDYYDDLGRMIDPYDGNGQYQRARRNGDDYDKDDYHDDEEVSDVGSDELGSDDDDNDSEDDNLSDDIKKPHERIAPKAYLDDHAEKYDRQNDARNAPTPIFPGNNHDGNLGVGYDERYDEFDPISENTERHFDTNGVSGDDFGNPMETDQRKDHIETQNNKNCSPMNVNPLSDEPFDEFQNSNHMDQPYQENDELYLESRNEQPFDASFVTEPPNGERKSASDDGPVFA